MTCLAATTKKAFSTNEKGLTVSFTSELAGWRHATHVPSCKMLHARMLVLADAAIGWWVDVFVLGCTLTLVVSSVMISSDFPLAQDPAAVLAKELMWQMYRWPSGQSRTIEFSARHLTVVRQIEQILEYYKYAKYLITKPQKQQIKYQRKTPALSFRVQTHDN